MEKIFQILSVFVLLMLAITYFIRGRESRYLEYVFTGRFTFPLFAYPGEVVSVVLRPSYLGDLPVYEGDLFVAGTIREVDPPVEAEDKDNGLLFRRGEGRVLEVADVATGQRVQVLPLEEEPDAILFDPGTRLIYCCSVNGKLTVIRQSGRERYTVMQELAISPGAVRLSLDPRNGKLYVQAGTFVSVYGQS